MGDFSLLAYPLLHYPGPTGTAQGIPGHGQWAESSWARLVLLASAFTLRSRQADGHNVGKTKSGFTNFRFQDMTQQPEKSDQGDARKLWRHILSGTPLVGFFRILRRILKPKSGETRLRSRPVGGIKLGSARVVGPRFHPI